MNSRVPGGPVSSNVIGPPSGSTVMLRRVEPDRASFYPLSAILARMRWWRHSRLVRTVAMILLLWTAADLSNASLCALDNEGANAGPLGSGTTLQDGSSAPGPAQLPQHIDDCFCCSHCVDVHVFLPATLVTPVALQQTQLVLSAPRIFGSRLYHPPLALLQ